MTERILSHWSLDTDHSKYVSLVNVKVTVKPDRLFDLMVQAFEKEYDRVGSRMPGEVLRLNLKDYLYTLLYLHVCNVNDYRPNGYQRKFYSKEVAIPSAFITFLAQIGEVTDRDMGLIFQPQMEAASDRLLAESEMREISYELFAISDLGLSLEKGLPDPSKCGSLGTMAAVLVESGDILSYRKDHPVYGFVAAVCQFNELVNVLGIQGLRVRYGTIGEYEMIAANFLKVSDYED